MVMNEHEGKIVVLADSTACTGFRLAGISDVYAAKGLEAEKKLEELLGSQDVGIIMVGEGIMQDVDWKLKRKIERTARPVVIAFPGKEGPLEQKGDSLRDMVKKALGFELMK